MERHAAVLSEKWFKACDEVTLSSGEKHTKTPNGAAQDHRVFWSVGLPLYDPLLIRVPVLTVQAPLTR